MKPMTRILTLLLACVMVIAAVPALADGEWVCPNCGRENPGRANFCGSCRTEKPADPSVPVAEANAWVCPGCAEVCPNEDRFCMICGTEHGETDPAAYLAPVVELREATFDPVPVEIMPGEFTSNGQTATFSYAPAVSGTYGICISRAPYGVTVHVTVNSTQGYKVKDGYLNQGDSIHFDLEAGEEYTVTQMQYRGTGAYTLEFGTPRAPADIGGIQVIRDSISYEDQDNRYEFTPTVTGTYHFGLAQADKDVTVYLDVRDSFDSRVKDGYLNQGEGVTAELEAGERYCVHVYQYRGCKPYTLRVGYAKETVDISGFAVIGDQIYFEDQAIVYGITVPEDAPYTFSIANADRGCTFLVAVYDDGGYKLRDGYLDQGDYVNTDLQKNTRYTVVVRQYRGTGDFTLLISH